MGIHETDTPSVIDGMGIQEMMSMLSGMGYNVARLSNEEIEALVIETLDGGEADVDDLFDGFYTP